MTKLNIVLSTDEAMEKILKDNLQPGYKNFACLNHTNYGAIILRGVYKGSILPITELEAYKMYEWEPIYYIITCSVSNNPDIKESKRFRQSQYDIITNYDRSMFKLEHEGKQADPTATVKDEINNTIQMGDVVCYVDRYAHGDSLMQFGTVSEIKKSGMIYVKNSLDPKRKAIKVKRHELLKLTEEQKKLLLLRKLASGK